MISTSIVVAVDCGDEAVPAVRLAVQELRRVLVRITHRLVSVVDAAGAAQAIVLSVDPELTDDPMDDAIAIDVQGAVGRIVGSNPRSLLIATYRFLHELGCRWVRPGPDGESLPDVDIDRADIRLVEHAHHRHRGVCLEGAVSVENALDMIEWLPRIGMNSYFIQFDSPHYFLRRWYERHEDPAGPPRQYPRSAQSPLLHQMLIDAMEARGLIHHAVGHGWTAAAIGVHAEGWDPSDTATFRRDLVAQVGGVRDLWDGIPLNTELCYSQQEVRTLMAEAIVEHAVAHPEIDVLHVWLSDGTRNHCECDDCRTRRPADWYVMLLNDVDARLTAADVTTRVGFLAYSQLLWAPMSERLANPDRFVFMFAPILRDPRVPLAAADETRVPPYDGNRTPYPRENRDLLGLLAEWRRCYEGSSSFDFDYHLMWQYCFDPGHLTIARTLHRDAQTLHGLGLDGFISCQSQRVFSPDGFAVAVLARTLWDSETPFEEAAADYYAAAFGADGPVVRDHLTRLSSLAREWNLDRLMSRQPTVDRESVTLLARQLAEFGGVLDRHRDDTEPVRSASWRILGLHTQLWQDMCGVLLAIAEGSPALALERWRGVTATIWQRQDSFQSAFDATIFCATWTKALNRILPSP